MESTNRATDQNTAGPSVNTDIEFNTIAEAIQDIKDGKLIIVVDDEDRENEGDFIASAELITKEQINFMARYGRGLICTPVTEQRAEELKLAKMVLDNTALHETAFTVSIDYVHKGCTTGISAYDRSVGIQEIVKPETKATDYARPGHIFPLIAKDGGVLRRTGHTEAAVDLAQLAGLYPAGVLVEILNEDGSMARLPDLKIIAKEHNLKLISIKDLVKYRLATETLVSKTYETQIDTEYGLFNVTAFTEGTSDAIHLALHIGDLSTNDTLVRMHSLARTGGALGFLLDNYVDRIGNALKMIQEKGSGVVVLLQHDDQVSTILQKLKLMDVDDSNDPQVSDIQKDFGIGAQILRQLGLENITVITSNPKKQIALEGYGLKVVGYKEF